MTPLARVLLDRIAAEGPLPLSAYMAECLIHPAHGYYTTRDPLGAAGDFTTAPEISQMFGEMLGLCLAQAWVDQGRPAPFVLAELGPGRGTLMADVLRAIRAVPGMAEAAQVHLVEVSAPLRARQRAAIAAEVTWHDSIATLPEGPLFLLANEFFDALPIRQFQRVGGDWAERQVAAGPEGLRLGLGKPSDLGALAHRLADTREGDVVEICPAAGPIAAEIGGRIARHGGVALVIDYGGWRSLGDTFQALRDHRPEDPLANPGAADLTAHVDFEPIAQAARAAGAEVSGLTGQGAFLERLGITDRARALAARMTGAALDSHIAAHRRLTHPQEMGTLFKVLGIHAAGSPLPAGLNPPDARA